MTEIEKKSLQALMEQHNVAGFNLDELEMRLENLRVVPYDIAEKNLILPVSVTANRITLVMADPTNDQIKEEIGFVTGKQVIANVAEPAQLTTAIKDCYTAYRAGETVYRGKNAAKIKISVSSGIGQGNSDIEVRVNTSGFTPRLSSIPPSAPTESQHDESAILAKKYRKKILVVDDEKEILLLISKVLEAEGHQIITTARGLEAIKKIQSEKLDLVILDAMLPEIHGFDICKQIKEDDTYKHLPVIMISAIYRGWRYAKDLKESYGVDDFIEKPFNIEELVKTVDKYCNEESTPQPGSSPNISETTKEMLVSGMKMYREGNIDEAITRLSEAIENDSTNFELHYNLALLLGKKGFAHQAILTLETALGLNPDNFAALKNLAVLYQKTAFKLKAIETWERTLDASPDKKTRDGIKRHLVDLL
jgi:DNA-binding response OmpR family regulator